MGVAIEVDTANLLALRLPARGGGEVDPTVPRAKQRTPELRDHVLSVAVGLLAREGVAGFTARNVAREAQTSTPAVYELFGDKGGLIRELFFEGFRLLQRHLETFVETEDPRADVVALVELYRGFIRENPVLSEVMFAHPFTDFEASRSELRAGAAVRAFVVERVRRCIDAGLMRGDEEDIALVLIACTEGLATAESSDRLGSTRESIDRRWALAVDAMLDGLGR
jgi:AcrR family transcriptional regulator